MLGRSHRMKAVQSSEQITTVALVLLSDVLRGNHSAGKNCAKYS